MIIIRTFYNGMIVYERELYVGLLDIVDTYVGLMLIGMMIWKMKVNKMIKKVKSNVRTSTVIN